MNSIVCKNFHATGRYVIILVYQMLRGDKPKVRWMYLIKGNVARPRGVFTLWMNCQGRLNTNHRLAKIGTNTNGLCVY